MKNPTNGDGTKAISNMNREKILIHRFIYSKYILLPEINSTNEYCKSKYVVSDRIVRALKQTSGRGRMGRSFLSEEGGFYISYCYFPENLMVQDLLPITGLCAVAVSKALERVAGIKAEIKWTNDLIFMGKKICGILTEPVLDHNGRVERLIIGFGINTNQPKNCFDGELANIASSIFALTGTRVDEDDLLICLSLLLQGIYDAVCTKNRIVINDHVKYYRSRCITIGKEISILRPSLVENGRDPKEVYNETPDIFPKATAIGIDENFGLIVRHGDGSEEILTFGEVSVR